MSPTRRDILKLATGTVATALTASAARCRIVEPITAAPVPEYVSWSVTAPIMMDASDGRRICFLPQEDHTLVHLYEAGARDYQTIVIEGGEAECFYGMVCAISKGLAVQLEAPGTSRRLRRTRMHSRGHRNAPRAQQSGALTERTCRPL
jgi:hypothetical protein